MVWMVIAFSSALIFGLSPVKMLAANALIVLATLYLFQGLSILAFFMKRQDFSPWWRMLCYVLTVLFLKFVAIFLVAVGFFDTWFNFRKLEGAT